MNSNAQFFLKKTIILSLIISSFCMLSLSCTRQANLLKHDEQAEEKVFLILAHPDDETMIGGFLLELKRLHIPVYAMYLTSGEGGKQQVLNDKGEWQGQKIEDTKLKNIREHELSQVALNYGYQDYFLLKQKDAPLRDQQGLPIRDGQVFLQKKIWNKQYIEKKILILFEQYQPTYVIGMSLDKHTHAHHKASRLLLDQLKLTEKFSFIKGVYAFSETGWVESSEEDEKKITKITLDRKQKFPGTGQNYAHINAQVAGGHYSQRSGHIGPWSHKEEIYQVEGSLLDFYQMLCKQQDCKPQLRYFVHEGTQ